MDDGIHEYKEIGSEFWSIPTRMSGNNVFPASCCWFMSGRSALLAIINTIQQKRSIRKVAIPDWYCESMVIPFQKNGITVEFYPWNEINIETDADTLYIMDYFGYRRTHNINGYKGIVIRDLTHSLFCENSADADYYYGSLRKWAGFYTGGFAWGPGLESPKEIDENYVDLRKLAMAQKEKYINGETENKDYLRVFGQAESLLDKYGVASALEQDVWSARHLDVELIRRKRRENANVLINAFPDNVLFKGLEADDCPLFVPALFNDRDGLRKKLIDERIYCPVHWNGKEFDGKEISIICDQRYSIEDMERIVKAIKDYYA